MNKRECSELDCLLCFGRECHKVGVCRIDGKCKSKLTWDDEPTLASTRDYEGTTRGTSIDWKPGDCHHLIDGLPVEETLFLAVLARAQDRLMLKSEMEKAVE